MAQRTDIYCLLPDSTFERYLVVNQDGRWGLPSLRLDRLQWPAEVEPACTAFHNRWDLYPIVLRTLDYVLDFDDDDCHGWILYLLELPDSTWRTPAEHKWMTPRDLLRLDSLPLELNDAVARYIRETARESADGLALPTWTRSGWYQVAADWIARELQTRGLDLTAPVVQTKSWSIAALLRAETTAGRYYFKASADLPLFVNEARLLAALVERHPSVLPEIVATDPARGWTLMREFGRLVDWGAPLETRCAVMKAFAEFQTQTVDELDWLTASGCTDRRLPVLASQIGALLEDSAALKVLPEEELYRLQSIVPELNERCRELARFDLPATLVHGDLHMGNVAHAGEETGGFVFFDWTDACISHPFMDTHSLFFETDLEKRRQLRDAYLASWADFAPLDRLRTAWSVAAPLIALHQAVSYQQILVNQDPSQRRALFSAWPHFLRQATLLAELV